MSIVWSPMAGYRSRQAEGGAAVGSGHSMPRSATKGPLPARAAAAVAALRAQQGPERWGCAWAG